MRRPGQALWRRRRRLRLVKDRPPIVQRAAIPTKRPASRRRPASVVTMSYRRYLRRATPRNSLQQSPKGANTPQTRRTDSDVAALRAKPGAIEGGGPPARSFELRIDKLVPRSRLTLGLHDRPHMPSRRGDRPGLTSWPGRAATARRRPFYRHWLVRCQCPPSE